jgi:hypothetical protein
MEKGEKVPGAPDRATTAYDICQALAWLAKGRRDVQIAFERALGIEKLIETLTRKPASRRTKVDDSADE